VIILLMNLLLFLQFSQFFSLKLVIWWQGTGPPKIRCFRRPRDSRRKSTLFSAVVLAATESQPLFSAVVLAAAKNKLFSAAGPWPPKIKVYFRLIFSSGQEPPRISLRRQNSLFSAAKALFSVVPGRLK
jgi:hypothetical protein